LKQFSPCKTQLINHLRLQRSIEMMMSMEKTTKASLFCALLLMAFLIGTEGGRDVPKKDMVYSPQTFWGLGLGWPFLGGWPWNIPLFGSPGALGGVGNAGPPALGPGLGGLIPGIGGGGPKGVGGIPVADINGAEATSP
jgi:hypothetical protein